MSIIPNERARRVDPDTRRQDPHPENVLKLMRAMMALAIEPDTRCDFHTTVDWTRQVTGLTRGSELSGHGESPTEFEITVPWPYTLNVHAIYETMAVAQCSIVNHGSHLTTAFISGWLHGYHFFFSILTASEVIEEAIKAWDASVPPELPEGVSESDQDRCGFCQARAGDDVDPAIWWTDHMQYEHRTVMYDRDYFFENSIVGTVRDKQLRRDLLILQGTARTDAERLLGLPRERQCSWLNIPFESDE